MYAALDTQNNRISFCLATSISCEVGLMGLTKDVDHDGFHLLVRCQNFKCFHNLDRDFSKKSCSHRSESGEEAKSILGYCCQGKHTQYWFLYRTDLSRLVV